VIRGLAVVGVALSLVACSEPSERRASTNVLDDDAITVASFDFPESELLAQIYGQALRDGGYRVEFESRLGPREFVDPALLRGLVELVPEYAGTALQFASLGSVRPSASTAANHRKLVDRLAGSSVVALAPSPAQDSNVLVTTRAVAARYRLRTISDLTDLAPRLVFGAPPECPIRPFCLPGLERTYGLQFEQVLALDVGGPLTHQVLAAGDADVALLFSTDSRITEDGLVVLRDDRHLQPAENVTPLIRRELVDRWGADLTDLIDGVSRRLTTQELRRLNGELTDTPGSAGTTAARWLAKERVP
jgi:osmoprotectant transport system substrate-binding protein